MHVHDVITNGDAYFTHHEILHVCVVRSIHTGKYIGKQLAPETSIQE